jgi:hypothetical protein
MPHEMHIRSARGLDLGLFLLGIEDGRSPGAIGGSMDGIGSRVDGNSRLATCWQVLRGALTHGIIRVIPIGEAFCSTGQVPSPFLCLALLHQLII